ncbi:MAG: hypothetical protein Q9209_007027 [Squamulea sp. 1 TL-2023]
MTSVRSMLRDERANRRITHPHLTYSTTGTLFCQICHTQIKTEALWNKHLPSVQHATNLQGHRETALAAPALVEDSNKGIGSKKRKADDDSSDNDTRKRTKGESPSGSIYGDEQGTSLASHYHGDVRPMNDRESKQSIESSESPRISSKPPKTQPNGHPSSPSPPTHQPNPVNEDEWAAFQRDLASPSPPPPEPSALTAAADISAAPMTAAELAAQSREQASRQAKERMEAEAEGEKEDAARQMEEELDEMAELEDRVKRLKEKREKLRVRKSEGDGKEDTVPPDEGAGDGGGVDGGGSGDDSDDDDDDENDEWGLWGRYNS